MEGANGRTGGDHSLIDGWSQRSSMQLASGVKKPASRNSSAFRIMAALHSP